MAPETVYVYIQVGSVYFKYWFIDLLTKEKIAISDSQQYHLNLYLINDLEDIVVFFRFKSFKFWLFLHVCPAVEMYSHFCRETTIENDKVLK